MEHVYTFSKTYAFTHVAAQIFRNLYSNLYANQFKIHPHSHISDKVKQKNSPTLIHLNSMWLNHTCKQITLWHSQTCHANSNPYIDIHSYKHKFQIP